MVTKPFCYLLLTIKQICEYNTYSHESENSVYSRKSARALIEGVALEFGQSPLLHLGKIRIF
jgi:hypothetical protein